MYQTGSYNPPAAGLRIREQLPAISLMPKGNDPTHWTESYSAYAVTVDGTAPHCRIDDGPLLNQIFYTTSGIIAERDLLALGKKTTVWLALTILRLHLLTEQNISEAARNAHNMIQAVCLAETKKPPSVRKTIPNYLSNFALHTTNITWLRLDEYGYSICSGYMVIDVQFLFIEHLEAGFRIWFRYPSEGVSLITMDLSEDELPGLVARVNFGKHAEWSVSMGQRKAVVCRANLTSIVPFLATSKASEPYPDLTNGRFDVTLNSLGWMMISASGAGLGRE
jgi:hypothetical protein